MKKPVIHDYGITENDLATVRSIKKWLKVVAVLQMFAGFLVMSWMKTLPTAILYLVMLFATPPLGPMIFYLILRFIFSTLSPSMKAARKYEDDCAGYEKWWLRTKEMFWSSLSGYQLEHELAKLYRHLGFRAHVTAASDDKGVDIWLIRNGQRIPVQCKAHKRPVGPSAAREFYGTMIHLNADVGVLASVSGFTSGVTEYVRNKPIELIDLKWILSKQKQMENYGTVYLRLDTKQQRGLR